MVITRSACLAASAAEPTATAPRATAASSAAGTMSKATTAKPFFTRLFTMGWPMVPVPINPTFMRVRPPWLVLDCYHPGPRRRRQAATLPSRGGPRPYDGAMIVGLLLIALAAISWGTTGSVTTVLVATIGAEPLLIGAARMAVAAIALFLAVGLRREALAP